MGQDVVRNVVETHLQDNWTQTPIQWENVHFEPIEGQSFIAPVIVPTSGIQISLGGVALNRWEGFIDISVFIPMNQGSKTGNDLADALIKLFYHYTEQGVSFYTGYAKPTGSTESWWKINVTIPYYFDELI